MGQEWEIRHTDCDVVKAHDGEIVLEWDLNRYPEEQWIKFFISGPGHSSGTMEFRSRTPQISGKKIRFQVREEDMGNALERVDSRVAGANQMFDTYVMSTRRERKPGSKRRLLRTNVGFRKLASG